MVMRLIEPLRLVNQRAPSGPAVIAAGPSPLGSGYFDTTPDVVIRPIEFAAEKLVNQRAPSEPVVMSVGQSLPVRE